MLPESSILRLCLFAQKYRIGLLLLLLFASFLSLHISCAKSIGRSLSTGSLFNLKYIVGCQDLSGAMNKWALF